MCNAKEEEDHGIFLYTTFDNYKRIASVFILLLFYSYVFQSIAY